MNEQLSPTILSELRGLLEAERAQVQARIRALRSAQGADELQDVLLSGGPATDRGDQAADLAEWDREHINEMDLLTRLDEIEHALAKFDAGTYGLCEGCGRPIPLARLRALPEARYDLEHEAALERRIGTARRPADEEEA